jgi:hypothetical protein
VGLAPSRPVAVTVGAGLQILVHGELREDTAPLRHLGDPAPHNGPGIHGIQAHAVELDGALGDLAMLKRQQPGDGPQEGRLAGAVGAQQRDDLAVRHLQGHAPQGEHHVVIHNLEVADG